MKSIADIKVSAAGAGCWIDGHWGHYGAARMIELAAELGYVDPATTPPFAQRDIVEVARRELSFMGTNMTKDTRTAEEQMADSEEISWTVDDVEAWMNEHVAPEGYSFGWHEGEFFLWSDASWGES